MSFGRQLGRGTKRIFKSYGKALRGELSKSGKILKKAFKEAAKDMISDAIVQIVMELVQSLAMTYIIEPLIRKINKLCKQLGWDTREFLATA